MIKNAEYILTMLLFLLLSCERDEKLLIGRWNMVSTTLVNYYMNEEISDTTFSYKSGQNVLELLEDGTARIYRYNDLIGNYNWEINRKYLIINYYTDPTIGSSSSRYEYTINDAILNLKSEGTTKFHENNYRFVLLDVYSRD
jgi:hypothetical protein